MKKTFLKNSQENTCTEISFFKKLVVWRPATLLEKDPSLAASAFSEFRKIFKRAFLQSSSRRSLLTWRCFFVFCRSTRFAAYKQCIRSSNAILAKWIHKPIVVMDISGEFHLPRDYYDSFKEKVEDL